MLTAYKVVFKVSCISGLPQDLWDLPLILQFPNDYSEETRMSVDIVESQPQNLISGFLVILRVDTTLSELYSFHICFCILLTLCFWDEYFLTSFWLCVNFPTTTFCRYLYKECLGSLSLSLSYIDRDSFKVSVWFSVTCKSHKLERVQVCCMRMCVCVTVLAQVCMYTGMYIWCLWRYKQVLILVFHLWFKLLINQATYQLATR